VKELSGKTATKRIKVGIVVGLFNGFIGERLLEGAVDVLTKNGVKENDLTVVKVPGCFELPVAAQRLGKSGNVDAVICLGTLIRGETPHFDHLSAEVTRGIGEVALKLDLPVTYGVITADSVEQAMNRAGLKLGNKGADAALAALHMVKVLREIDENR